VELVQTYFNTKKQPEGEHHEPHEQS